MLLLSINLIFDLNNMPNISIYLTDEQMKLLNRIAENNNKSALIASLIEQECQRKEKEAMVKAAQEIDMLGLGWTEEEEECAIIDMEVSG